MITGDLPVCEPISPAGPEEYGAAVENCPQLTAMATRDRDRRQVYAAEELAAEQTILVAEQSVEYLQETADQLLGSSWWTSNFGADPVAVMLNRSNQRSFYDPDRRLVSLSPVSADLGTLCHELAHTAAFDHGSDGAVHGSRFRSLHVAVRAAVLGSPCAEDLRAVYGQFNLAVPTIRDLHHAPDDPILPGTLYERTVVVGRPSAGSSSASAHGPIAL
jgi:hypothetical protein